MPVPPRHDPTWQVLVEHPDRYAYHFLALRILMQRIARKAPVSATDRDSAIDEVYAFFIKNEKLVAADLQAIFG